MPAGERGRGRVPHPQPTPAVVFVPETPAAALDVVAPVPIRQLCLLTHPMDLCLFGHDGSVVVPIAALLAAMDDVALVEVVALELVPAALCVFLTAKQLLHHRVNSVLAAVVLMFLLCGDV